MSPRKPLTRDENRHAWADAIAAHKRGDPQPTLDELARAEDEATAAAVDALVDDPFRKGHKVAPHLAKVHPVRRNLERAVGQHYATEGDAT